MSVELSLQPLRRAVVTASALRLREQPTTSSPMLSSVPRGTTVEVIGVAPGELWTQVKAGRRIGWMASKYLVAEDHPLVPKSPREEFPWMPIATSELGVREVLGEGVNPRVAQYLGSTNLDRKAASDDSTPWCSGFVNWCVEKAGLVGTDSASARSWLDWGRPITMPRRGCVSVFKRDGGGHVGFYIGRTQTHIQVLGGNQSNMVSVAAYDALRLLGYRVPS